MRTRTTIPVSVAVAAIVAAAACEFNLTQPSPGGQSSATTTNVTVTNVPTGPTGPTGGTGPTTPTTPVPIPAGAQAIVAGVAAANPTLIAQSCQQTYGAAAWLYLDLVVDTLRVGDPRWGYACRPAGACATPVEDVIAYYGAAGAPTTGAVGIWIVDVIGNWCGATPTATYQALPYDAARAWTSRGRF